MEKTQTERLVDRLNLCSEVIQRSHKDFNTPANPEEKADLLLSIENLARSVMLFRKDALDQLWPGDVPEDD